MTASARLVLTILLALPGAAAHPGDASPGDASVPVPAADPGAPPGATAAPARPRYVASAGKVYLWDGASPRVSPVDDRKSLPEGGETLVLRDYAGGERLLLLQRSVTASGKERDRHEGLSLVLDAQGTVLRRLHQIPFDGEPFDVAIAADDRRAYVLARRLSPGGPTGTGRFWIHAIDLEEGRLLVSAQLSSAPAGIAVQPDGRRLFVAIPNRIQSFTTDSLVSSWHYRSPGPNRDLVIRSGDGTLFVTRGEEVALFDPRAIAARADADRRARTDDATAVVHLPFEARGLDLSEDGQVAAVLGSDRLAYLDGARPSLLWPADPPRGLAGAADVRTLAFPAAGLDLVAALFPTGEVLGFRTPAPSAPLSSRSDAAEPGPVAAAPAAPVTANPVPGGATPGAPATAAPTPEAAQRVDAASEPADAPAAAPAGADTVPVDSPPAAEPSSESNPEVPAGLSGRIKGDRARVEAIVFYGPNSIVKEFGRVRPGPDGAWRAPLPPPGIYRLVPVGDVPAPLPSSPAFLTIKVAADETLSGLDFEIAPGQAKDPGPRR